jgi:hypothetical protein
MRILGKPLLAPILMSDALTRGLADPEARILVEWLVEQAERLASGPIEDAQIGRRVQQLCRRGRAISRFVTLWCHEHERGAACQLAASERFTWPLPSDRDIDPCELMQSILDCEEVMN